MASEGSILAVDIGSVHTRLLLLDLVDGSYRLVARAVTGSTAGFPFNDVNVGLARAAREITSFTNRPLMQRDGRLIIPEQADRSGVDYFAATASTGRPLRAVLTGLVPEISITSGLRAAAGTYVEIVATFSLDDRRTLEEQINAFISARPDLVLLTGGTEGGARAPVLEQVKMVELALRLLDAPQRPVVLYAGNSALADEIRTRFSGLASVFIAPNVRPTLQDENLEGAQLQLGRVFDEYKANRGGGFDTIGDMSSTGVMPTAQSYDLLMEFLGRAQESPVLAVDVGSAVSTLSAFVNDRTHTVIRTDIGLGHSAGALVGILGSAAITDWLPFVVAEEEVLNYAANKTLRPTTIPQSLRDLYLEHALLRAGIRDMVVGALPVWTEAATVDAQTLLPPFATVIGAGAALTQLGNPGLSALLLLDALQPAGMTTLNLDPHGLIPALGALAYDRPEAVVQVLDGSGLERLGTAFCLSGAVRPGRPALKVRITTEDGRLIQHPVAGGELWRYDLPAGQTVKVDVRVVARGASLGGKSRLTLDVEGGTAGLIFDARGRPLALATDPAGRAQQMPQWIAQVTGQPVQPIPEGWLVSLAKQAAQGTQPAADGGDGRKPARRRLRRLADEPPAEEEVEVRDVLP